VTEFRNNLWKTYEATPTLHRDMVSGRPWTEKETMIPALLSRPLYVVLNVHGGKARFLVYDEIQRTFVSIGATAADAARAWNFADLGCWMAVDDETGDTEDFSPDDPSINEAVEKALADLGMKSNAVSTEAENRAWAEIQKGCRRINDDAFSTLVGPQVPRMLEIISTATVKEARQLRFGEEYQQTLNLSQLKSGSVFEIGKQIYQRYRHSVPTLYGAGATIPT